MSTVTATTFRPAVAPPARAFDGIVCFGGEDWWYHNRGHYDMQMVRRVAPVPVLYVNSLGMRMPSPREGRGFARRVARKLRSCCRGLVRVDERFSVFSPLSIPTRRAAAFTRRVTARQVAAAAAACGIRRPLVWVACPPAIEVMDGLDAAGFVYQRTDRYECFHGVDPARIAGFDRRLKARADLTLFCTRHLHETEADGCRRAAYVDHGVDFRRFETAGLDLVEEPPDMAPLPRPRAGFVGGIDAHTFDPSLLRDVAARLPEVHFALVGGCSLPAGWCPLPNVSLLGRRPYESVPAYMAACDVLIMPWNDSPWIRACNPVKLKEYLAVGRPVVSTPFPELLAYAPPVRIATGAEAFAGAVRRALDEPHDPEPGRRLVRGATWSARARRVAETLGDLGLRAAG